MLAGFLYGIPWILAIALEFCFNTKISYQPDIYLIFFILVSIFLVSVFGRNNNKYYKFIKYDSSKLIQNRRESIILIIFVSGFSLTSIYENFNYPALKIFSQNALEYNEYGIKSLQGLINACYLCISTIFIYKIFYSKNKIKNSKLIIFLIILYPVLLLSRQLIFS